MTGIINWLFGLRPDPVVVDGIHDILDRLDEREEQGIVHQDYRPGGTADLGTEVLLEKMRKAAATSNQQTGYDSLKQLIAHLEYRRRMNLEEERSGRIPVGRLEGRPPDQRGQKDDREDRDDRNDDDREQQGGGRRRRNRNKGNGGNDRNEPNQEQKGSKSNGGNPPANFDVQ